MNKVEASQKKTLLGKKAQPQEFQTLLRAKAKCKSNRPRCSEGIYSKENIEYSPTFTGGLNSTEVGSRHRFRGTENYIDRCHKTNLEQVVTSGSSGLININYPQRRWNFKERTVSLNFPNGYHPSVPYGMERPQTIHVERKDCTQEIKSVRQNNDMKGNLIFRGRTRESNGGMGVQEGMTIYQPSKRVMFAPDRQIKEFRNCSPVKTLLNSGIRKSPIPIIRTPSCSSNDGGHISVGKREPDTSLHSLPFGERNNTENWNTELNSLHRNVDQTETPMNSLRGGNARNNFTKRPLWKSPFFVSMVPFEFQPLYQRVIRSERKIITLFSATQNDNKSLMRILYRACHTEEVLFEVEMNRHLMLEKSSVVLERLEKLDILLYKGNKLLTRYYPLIDQWYEKRREYQYSVELFQKDLSNLVCDMNGTFERAYSLQKEILGEMEMIKELLRENQCLLRGDSHKSEI